MWAGVKLVDCLRDVLREGTFDDVAFDSFRPRGVVRFVGWIIRVPPIPRDVRLVELLTELDPCEVPLSLLVGLLEDRRGVRRD